MKPGDWISIGDGLKQAIVSHVIDDDNVEAVYLRSDNQAIAEDFIRKDGQWQFRHEGAQGGMRADSSSRLSDFVRKLRAHQHQPRR